MEANLIDRKPPEVCNIVFFDIETTGLLASHNPRITELSLCAVDRLNFLSNNPNTIPRVMNKLSLCVYPCRQIDLMASEISLLYNDNLEKQGRFDSAVDPLLGFLKRLEPPVCLVAHNGNKFDFPILKAELEKQNVCIPEDLLCADSLPVFKKIISRPITSTTMATTPNIMDNHLSNINNVSFQITNEATPKKQQIPEVQTAPTPNKHIRKKLDVSEQQNGTSLKRIRYDLESVYRQMCNESCPLECHRAENDVLMLLLSSIRFPKDFLSYIEEEAVPLSKITKAW